MRFKKKYEICREHAIIECQGTLYHVVSQMLSEPDVVNLAYLSGGMPGVKILPFNHEGSCPGQIHLSYFLWSAVVSSSSSSWKIECLLELHSAHVFALACHLPP